MAPNMLTVVAVVADVADVVAIIAAVCCLGLGLRTRLFGAFGWPPMLACVKIKINSPCLLHLRWVIAYTILYEIKSHFFCI